MLERDLMIWNRRLVEISKIIPNNWSVTMRAAGGLSIALPGLDAMPEGMLTKIQRITDGARLDVKFVKDVLTLEVKE